MKRSLTTAVALALLVSGCGQIRGFFGAPPSQVPAPAAVSLAEPAPGQPAAHQVRGWRDLPRNIPYVNMTAQALPIYDAAQNGARKGTLAPGEGGYLKTCSDARPVCQIRYGADGATGWVRMDQMGGMTN